MSRHSTISDVASTVNDLGYMDLRTIGEALYDMCKEGNGARDFPKTATEFSDMLCDWADAVGS
jgi:hypothetical protein